MNSKRPPNSKESSPAKSVQLVAQMTLTHTALDSKQFSPSPAHKSTRMQTFRLTLTHMHDGAHTVAVAQLTPGNAPMFWVTPYVALVNSVSLRRADPHN